MFCQTVNNGYKPKTVYSRIGKLALKEPQEGDPVQFYPNALEKGLRSERALKLAMAKMYINGVSSPKVSAILMETSEEWETSKKHLTLEYDQLPN